MGSQPYNIVVLDWPGLPSDRQTRRALTAATYRRGGHLQRDIRQPGHVLTIHDRTVYRSTRALPYGRSARPNGRLAHLVDAIYTAWMAGRLVGSMARWMCGATSPCYRLAWEPVGSVCEICLAVAARSQRIEDTS